jgi:hypothetical protein
MLSARENYCPDQVIFRERSQLSYLDADAVDDAMEAPAELESQAQPVEIPSSDEISDCNSDNELRNLAE